MPPAKRPLKTLERVLSKAGLGSRTEARQWIGAGRVRVNGKLIQTPDHWVDLVRDRSAVRRRVGMLGHATFLYDDLSVTENVDFWARASGASVADGRAALDRLGVAPRLHDLPVHHLSAGQRRRVSFAAMVARRPELWLLDEPHAGLDAGGRDVVDGLMREAASVGATVLFASHELDRAGDVADRAVSVVGGVVVPEPSPHPAPHAAPDTDLPVQEVAP